MPLRKLYPFVYPVLIVLVFAFAIIGYREILGNEFDLWAVLLTVVNFFFLNDVDTHQLSVNPYILIAKYLATLLVAIGLFSISYKYLRNLILIYKIRLTFTYHIVIFSLDSIGYRISKDLLRKGYSVVVVENNSDSPFIEEIEKDGGIVISSNPFENKTLDRIGLSRAKVCILANNKDETNIEIAGNIRAYLLQSHALDQDLDKNVLKLHLHISDLNNLHVIKDYFDINNLDEQYDLHIINLDQRAAQKIYDDFPPHKYFGSHSLEDENSIAIIGCDKTAEAFIVENMILSHYKENSLLKIYLVDKDADTFFHHFTYQYPAYAEFVELIPVKLVNGSFFANFSWSKKNIEQLSKIKAAYFFGESDAVIMNTVASFRQFLYVQNLNFCQIPFIISLPEDIGLYDFLNSSPLHSNEFNQLNNTLNQFYIKRKSDTFSDKSLIEEYETYDTISRVINFYYTVLYGFSSTLQKCFNIQVDSDLIEECIRYFEDYPERYTYSTEKEFETNFFNFLSQKTGITSAKLLQKLSIQKCWNQLNNRKKDSNRYAARNIPVKLYFLEQIGCVPVNRQNIIRCYTHLASVEHSRWSGEKIVFGFKYGPFPTDKREKHLLKEVLKIHDQLIPYDKLTQEEKDKDLNLFLLLPLLLMLKNKTKKL